MRSYEKIKNQKFSDENFKLKILLKNYFKSLNDIELENICEDIAIKFNENKQIEKLKNLKKIFFYKKQKDKFLLLNSFNKWKNLNINLNNNNNKDKDKDSIINSSYFEDRIKRKKS
jgi:hypothetical protein